MNSDKVSQWKKHEAKKGSGYGIENLNKDLGQGVKKDKGGALASEKSRSVYKLFFKDEGTQSANEINGKESTKSALGLIKVKGAKSSGWGEKSYMLVKEEEINDSKKVGLIVAKSESSIYLIPVVRSSAKGGDADAEGKMTKDEDTKKIGGEGVDDIRMGTSSYDKSEDGKEPRNEQLQKSFNSGFSIIRGGDVVFVGGGKTITSELGRREVNKWLEKMEQGEKIEFLKGSSKEYIYQNAGILEGRGTKGSCKECKQAEKYFPLDIVVFGDKSKLKDKSSSYKNLIQEIEVNDTITEVMGVRLDQVVINLQFCFLDHGFVKDKN